MAELGHVGWVPHDELTPRESEVVNELMRGSTNRQIAERLCVSQKTVEHHLGSVYAKHGVHSRTELILLLLKGGRGQPGPT